MFWEADTVHWVTIDSDALIGAGATALGGASASAGKAAALPIIVTPAAEISKYAEGRALVDTKTETEYYGIGVVEVTTMLFVDADLDSQATGDGSVVLPAVIVTVRSVNGVIVDVHSSEFTDDTVWAREILDAYTG